MSDVIENVEVLNPAGITIRIFAPLIRVSRQSGVKCPRSSVYKFPSFFHLGPLRSAGRIQYEFLEKSEKRWGLRCPVPGENSEGFLVSSMAELIHEV
jgi:hypothetical protein